MTMNNLNSNGVDVKAEVLKIKESIKTLRCMLLDLYSQVCIIEPPTSRCKIHDREFIEIVDGQYECPKCYVLATKGACACCGAFETLDVRNLCFNCDMAYQENII